MMLWSSRIFKANSRNINIFTGLSGWQNQNNISIESFGLGNIENTTLKNYFLKYSKLSIAFASEKSQS
jgi:hypothetical protein